MKLGGVLNNSHPDICCPGPGSTISTNRYMIKSTLKNSRYCPLVIQGFSNFLGLFQGIMANPVGFTDFGGEWWFPGHRGDFFQQDPEFKKAVPEIEKGKHWEPSWLGF